MGKPIGQKTIQHIDQSGRPVQRVVKLVQVSSKYQSSASLVQFQSPNKTGPTDQIVLTPEQAMELGLIPNTSGGTTFAQQVKYRGTRLLSFGRSKIRGQTHTK